MILYVSHRPKVAKASKEGNIIAGVVALKFAGGNRDLLWKKDSSFLALSVNGEEKNVL
jgi:hypothetical protein